MGTGLAVYRLRRSDRFSSTRALPNPGPSSKVATLNKRLVSETFYESSDLRACAGCYWLHRNAAFAATTDDVKWINRCVADNKGGASPEVILKYCTCMNNKISDNAVNHRLGKYSCRRTQGLRPGSRLAIAAALKHHRRRTSLRSDAAKFFCSCRYPAADKTVASIPHGSPALFPRQPEIPARRRELRNTFPIVRLG